MEWFYKNIVEFLGDGSGHGDIFLSKFQIPYLSSQPSIDNMQDSVLSCRRMKNNCMLTINNNVIIAAINRRLRENIFFGTAPLISARDRCDDAEI